MAAPRNLRGLRMALDTDPQVWSTTLPRQPSLLSSRKASFVATSAMAESEVVIKNTEALSNLESELARGAPLPTNRAARRAAASLRAAMNAIGTPDSASRRPIACPIRPGPMRATLSIESDFRNYSSPRQNLYSQSPLAYHGGNVTRWCVISPLSIAYYLFVQPIGFLSWKLIL